MINSSFYNEIAEGLVVGIVPNMLAGFVFTLMGFTDGWFWFIPAVIFAVLHCFGWIAMLFVNIPLPSPLASATGQDRHYDD